MPTLTPSSSSPTSTCRRSSACPGRRQGRAGPPRTTSARSTSTSSGACSASAGARLPGRRSGLVEALHTRASRPPSSGAASTRARRPARPVPPRGEIGVPLYGAASTREGLPGAGRRSRLAGAGGGPDPRPHGDGRDAPAGTRASPWLPEAEWDTLTAPPRSSCRRPRSFLRHPGLGQGTGRPTSRSPVLRPRERSGGGLSTAGPGASTRPGASPRTRSEGARRARPGCVEAATAGRIPRYLATGS
jgi:hypothetical protein